MEQSPATNLRVEYCDQLFYRGMPIFSDSGFDFGEEGSDVFPGRFGEEFAVVFPNVFAEKIKTLVDVGDARFAL